MSGFFNLIKNLFAGIFGFLGGLLAGKKTPAKAAAKKTGGSGYFLEVEDAKSVGGASVSAPVATTTSATLNLPQPTVSFAADNLLPLSSNNGRRRPGANMTYFLGMARTAKVAR